MRLLKLIWAHGSTFVVNTALLIAGLVNLVFGCLLTISGQTVPATAALTAGLVLMFAGTVGRFELLKGWGIEARTKKLDDKITEANDVLVKMRRLAELSGETLMRLNATVGRLGGAPPVEQGQAVSMKVREMLRDLGSDPASIRSIVQPWTQTVAMDLAFALHSPWLAILNMQRDQLIAERQGIPAEDTARMTAINNRLEFITELTTRWNRERPKIQSVEATKAYLQSFCQARVINGATVESPLRESLLPWLPRLDYLARTDNLSDEDEWAEMLKRSK